jgi:hypothetical protein
MKAKFFGRLVSGLLAVAASMALGGCGAESKDAQPNDVATSDAAVTEGMRLQIRSMSSLKCLDVAGGYTNPDTPIVQYRCHQGLNQQFKLYNTFNGFQIQSMLDPNMCVGIHQAWWNELLYLVPCVDANGWRPYTTRWYLDSNDLQQPVSHAELRTVAAPRGTQQYCIDVPSGLDWDSLWMQIYGCHNGLNQQWELSNW